MVRGMLISQEPGSSCGLAHFAALPARLSLSYQWAQARFFVYQPNRTASGSPLLSGINRNVSIALENSAFEHTHAESRMKVVGPAN